MSYDPELSRLLGNTDIIAVIDDFTESEIRPTEEQFAAAPGDHAILLVTASDADKDITVLTLVEASEHTDLFPDYAERLQKSFVLAEWNSAMDPDGPYLGWFPRARLLMLTEAEYEEIAGQVKSGQLFRLKPPEWLFDKYTEALDNLAEHHPDRVPKPPVCPICKSRRVSIHVIQIREGRGAAGEMVVDGVTKSTTMSPLTPEFRMRGHLHCDSCGARGELDEDEIHDIDWL